MKYSMEFLYFDPDQDSVVYRLTIDDPAHLKEPIELDVLFNQGYLEMAEEPGWWMKEPRGDRTNGRDDLVCDVH
jgi:hypothetical protein